MWRSIFLHEFLDQQLSNYQALPGAAAHSLTLAREPQGFQSVQIRRGVALEHVLTKPLPQVVGISCHVRLTYPVNFHPEMFPVIRLGSQAEWLFWPEAPTGPGVEQVRALARVFIGAGFANLGNVALPATEFQDWRFDWHTSGQARMFVNGRLVAYHNAVAPGATLNVDRVVFGWPGPAGSNPLYRVARVFVRVLERPDALGHFARLLPVLELLPVPQNRCAQQVTRNVLGMLDRLRQFMSTVHQALSQPWTALAGDPAGPFQADAVRAHELATAAMAALAKMMRAADYAQRDVFLGPLGEFLRIVRAVKPAEFSALAAEIDGTPVVPEECKAMFAATADVNKDALLPLVTLLVEASELIRTIAGGN